MTYNIFTKNFKLKRRHIKHDNHSLNEYPPLLRKIYLHRGIDTVNDLQKSLNHLLSYDHLNDVHKAVKILYDSIKKKKRITVVGDFDADGATSTALVVLAIQSMGSHNINYLIPSRLKDGYGLSPSIVKQAYEIGTDLILTVDNGISSYEGVKEANKYNIPVLITDHHLPGNELPPAKAIVNPNLKDSKFLSCNLAGVGVAFYLMIALRAYLQKKKWFEKNKLSIPNLANFLDLVAIGTIADMVPLDKNNRILVWQGLNRIRSGKCRLGIKVLLDITHCNLYDLVANDLSFVIGSRLNAAGRLDSMSTGISLLLSNNIENIYYLANKLNALNEKRKKIEKKMNNQVIFLLKKLFEKNQKNSPSILIFYENNWHQGVVGILASRLKERFHCPVITFAPVDKDILKGSARSISNVHIYHLFVRFNHLYPGIILNFGGHAMAAGLSIEKKNYEKFYKIFTEFIKNFFHENNIQDIIWSDGELDPIEYTLKTTQILRHAGPWGQNFPEPSFDGKFLLINQKLAGNRHLKLTLKPLNGNNFINGILFNVNTLFWPNNDIKKVEIVYKLYMNNFRGNRQMQLLIEEIWPL